MLDAFREAPGHHLTNAELGRLFLRGGPQAFRSRISDLRDKGYKIPDAKRVSEGIYEYFLLNPKHESQPQSGQSLPPAPPPGSAAEAQEVADRSEAAESKLFDLPPAKPKPRGYGDSEAA